MTNSTSHDAQPDAMEQAFLDPDGRPIPITRIEFEKVGDTWRWNTWSGARRLLSIPAAGHVASLVEATHVLVEPARVFHPLHATSNRG